MGMRVKVLIAVAALAAFAPVGRAAELITLRNGFEMRCDHHGQVAGRVRLYLGGGEDNYVEFGPRDILGVEQVPDLPPDPAAPAEKLRSASPAAKLDARLSPVDLHEMLATAGHEHNVDVDLLASLVKAESGGNAHAVSPTGARGLMQLMPGTATGLGVENSFEPKQNVRGGTTYLDALLTRYHDNMALALAAYNAGPAAVDKYHGIPPYHETKVYVARVIHEFNRRVKAREALARQSIAAATPQVSPSR
jgi:hypothetical protein